MKVDNSSINDDLLGMRLAPGNGEIGPFEGYVEIVFSNYNYDSGSIIYYNPARIRINVSFVNNYGLDAESVKEWAQVLDTAYLLATSRISPATPQNVIDVWKSIRHKMLSKKQV